MPERSRNSGIGFPRLQPKSVRAKTVALLAVPVVSLMALWSMATVSAVQNAWTLHQVEQLNEKLAGPVRNLVGSLQDERAAAVRYLAAPQAAAEQAFAAERARTAQATAALLDGVTVARADIASLTPDVNQRVNALVQDLDRFQNARPADWTGAYDEYSAAIEHAFAVEEVLTTVQDGQPAAAARVVLQHSRVAEMIARQDAIATSAPAGGRMTPEQHRAFAAALGGQDVLAGGLLPELPAADQDAYRRLVDSDAYRFLRAMQNDMLDAGTAAFAPDQWRGAVQVLTQAVDTSQANARAAGAAQAESASRSVTTEAALTVLLGLLAVLLALAVSVRIGRGMVIELVGLRDSALELANRRLPQAMRRLRAGEKIDIDADVPVVAPGEGEIGQVGDALNAVQRSALQAAAERAELLTGVSGVFVNLARRSQSLVHRQLGILDGMERRTEDLAALEDLFRVDHLATRMRRHAEGLIIMSGAAPGRAWRQPVPLMDLVRSAVSEVEDYARVEIRRMPGLSVLGSSVSDVTHLFAELVENATTFSPPDSTVLVHGEPVGTGFVVEIEDRGLGMSAERLDEANRLITEAHRLELFESDRLGLYLVSRLANRQGITVSLRRSPYGGTTAVVLLPMSILASEPAAEPRDRPSEPDEPVRPPKKAIATRLPVRTPVPARQQVWVEPVTVDEPAPEPDTEPDTGGLPRRTRQASLAAGLQADTRSKRADAAAAPVSPEQARSMMSALQQGFARGRGAPTDDSADA
ncbi:nitrate- and nitrite sensing domain-containing protein [Saccharopolyspora sp. NPDC050389]|uniref:sensor histidine kinase n=1 Tax=Saccharopolyspora sp. NPDC050389 TaxID=3155516 RepID=UPI003409BABC